MINNSYRRGYSYGPLGLHYNENVYPNTIKTNLVESEGDDPLSIPDNWHSLLNPPYDPNYIENGSGFIGYNYLNTARVYGERCFLNVPNFLVRDRVDFNLLNAVTVEDYAFAGFATSNNRLLNFSDKIEYIGDYAFAQAGFSFANEFVLENIPELTYIGKNAFMRIEPASIIYDSGNSKFDYLPLNLVLDNPDLTIEESPFDQAFGFRQASSYPFLLEQDGSYSMRLPESKKDELKAIKLGSFEYMAGGLFKNLEYKGSTFRFLESYPKNTIFKSMFESYEGLATVTVENSGIQTIEDYAFKNFGSYKYNRFDKYFGVQEIAITNPQNPTFTSGAHHYKDLIRNLSSQNQIDDIPYHKETNISRIDFHPETILTEISPRAFENSDFLYLNVGKTPPTSFPRGSFGPKTASNMRCAFPWISLSARTAPKIEVGVDWSDSHKRKLEQEDRNNGLYHYVTNELDQFTMDLADQINENTDGQIFSEDSGNVSFEYCNIEELEFTPFYDNSPVPDGLAGYVTFDFAGTEYEQESGTNTAVYSFDMPSAFDTRDICSNGILSYSTGSGWGVEGTESEGGWDVSISLDQSGNETSSVGYYYDNAGSAIDGDVTINLTRFSSKTQPPSFTGIARTTATLALESFEKQSFPLEEFTYYDEVFNGFDPEGNPTFLTGDVFVEGPSFELPEGFEEVEFQYDTKLWRWKLNVECDVDFDEVFNSQGGAGTGYFSGLSTSCWTDQINPLKACYVSDFLDSKYYSPPQNARNLPEKLWFQEGIQELLSPFSNTNSKDPKFDWFANMHNESGYVYDYTVGDSSRVYYDVIIGPNDFGPAENYELETATDLATENKYRQSVPCGGDRGHAWLWEVDLRDKFSYLFNDEKSRNRRFRYGHVNQLFQQSIFGEIANSKLITGREFDQNFSPISLADQQKTSQIFRETLPMLGSSTKAPEMGMEYSQYFAKHNRLFERDYNINQDKLSENLVEVIEAQNHNIEECNSGHLVKNSVTCEYLHYNEMTDFFLNRFNYSELDSLQFVPESGELGVNNQLLQNRVYNNDYLIERLRLKLDEPHFNDLIETDGKNSYGSSCLGRAGSKQVPYTIGGAWVLRFHHTHPDNYEVDDSGEFTTGATPDLHAHQELDGIYIKWDYVRDGFGPAEYIIDVENDEAIDILQGRLDVSGTFSNLARFENSSIGDYTYQDRTGFRSESGFNPLYESKGVFGTGEDFLSFERPLIYQSQDLTGVVGETTGVDLFNPSKNIGIEHLKKVYRGQPISRYYNPDRKHADGDYLPFFNSLGIPSPNVIGVRDLDTQITTTGEFHLNSKMTQYLYATKSICETTGRKKLSGSARTAEELYGTRDISGSKYGYRTRGVLYVHPEVWPDYVGRDFNRYTGWKGRILPLEVGFSQFGCREKDDSWSNFSDFSFEYRVFRYVQNTAKVLWHLNVADPCEQ
jgi:hypothetical protein